MWHCLGSEPPTWPPNQNPEQTHLIVMNPQHQTFQKPWHNEAFTSHIRPDWSTDQTRGGRSSVYVHPRLGRNAESGSCWSFTPACHVTHLPKTQGRGELKKERLKVTPYCHRVGHVFQKAAMTLSCVGDNQISKFRLLSPIWPGSSAAAGPQRSAHPVSWDNSWWQTKHEAERRSLFSLE